MKRPRSRLLVIGAFFAAVAAFATVAGLSCAPKSDETPSQRCVPGKEYYCRCPDRSEGQWVCQEDYTFSACEPCDSLDSPYPTGSATTDPDPPDTDPPDTGPPPKCGDGVVQKDEDCDDGNTNDNDGCNGACRLSGSTPATSRSCPGLEVHVWGTRKATYTGWTTGSTNTGSASPPCSEGGKQVTGETSADRVFHVFAHAAGTMTVATRGTTFDHFIYVTNECKDRGKGEGASSMLACANATSTNEGETLVLPVEADQDVTVFVDGTGTSTGNFTVDFSIED